MEDVINTLKSMEEKLNDCATEGNWPDVVFVQTELNRIRQDLEIAATSKNWFTAQPHMEKVAEEYIEEALHGFTVGEILGEQFEGRFTYDEVESLLGNILTDYIVYLVYGGEPRC